MQHSNIPLVHWFPPFFKEHNTRERNFISQVSISTNESSFLRWQKRHSIKISHVWCVKALMLVWSLPQKMDALNTMPTQAFLFISLLPQKHKNPFKYLCSHQRKIKIPLGLPKGGSLYQAPIFCANQNYMKRNEPQVIILDIFQARESFSFLTHTLYLTSLFSQKTQFWFWNFWETQINHV